MDFEETTEHDEIVIISDHEDDMGVDEIFKSIVEAGQVRRDDRSSTVKIEGSKAIEMCKITDIDEVRLFLPSINDFQLKPAMIWKLIKDMIGKDMTKLELPCFVNEPSTLL